ncbi:MAG: SDR family NAD(P)-dependent oxidoreductase [Pirellulales bacterium]|nr:SDR family NAD(P)-dependent oxidoreductase [Pirellulales bacterium]
MQPVTFLTGASSGIGRALAPLLAADGHAVALVARRVHLLDEVAETIRAAGGRALPIECDVADFSSVQLAVQRCEDELGPVDRLIANAGMGRPTPVRNFRSSDFEVALATNFMGLVYCVEATLPGMLRRGGGQIVGVSSPAGWRGIPGSGAYSSSKAAMTNLLESLRIELLDQRVSVTTIEPGFVRTEMTDQNDFQMPFLLEPEDAARRIHRAILRRRRVFAFPWQIKVLFKSTNLLPLAIYDRLFARLTRQRNAFAEEQSR